MLVHIIISEITFKAHVTFFFRYLSAAHVRVVLINLCPVTHLYKNPFFYKLFFTKLINNYKNDQKFFSGNESKLIFILLFVNTLHKIYTSIQ